MSTESFAGRSLVEDPAPRQTWSKPDLIDYGSVADMTQGGFFFFPPNTENAIYTTSPV